MAQAEHSKAAKTKPRETADASDKQNPKQGSGGLIKKLLIAACVLAAAAGAFVYYSYSEVKSLSSFVVPAREEPYELKSGMSASEVINDLTAGHYPKYIVSVYLKMHRGEFDAIQKGAYLIDGQKSLIEILEAMREGQVFAEAPLKALILEGLSLPLMVERLLKTSSLEDDVKGCLEDTGAFVNQGLQAAFPVKSEEGEVSDESVALYPDDLKSLEGLFMPATYPYYKGDSACEILEESFVKMARTLKLEWEQREQGLPLKSPYEALILASIVERESSLAAERPIIAGVFYNRLEKSMRLQTDPTVMYGVSPSFRGPLKRSQLREDTPYNTYVRDGLPPTPIAMPSAAAIEAVLHPADTKALYFVAKSHDPTDGHVFSNTLREHQKAVSDYRQRVREYRRSQNK